MYAPPAFRWDDREAALSLARDFNFATLLTVDDGAPPARRLPLLVDARRNILRGSPARAYPYADCLDGCGHLAIFTGPHAYVSPDWRGEASADVPIWNYLAGHIRGEGRVIGDERPVDALPDKLSAYEERRRTALSFGDKIRAMDKGSSEKLARMRAASHVFEIKIAALEAVAELNQNKPSEARESVIGAVGLRQTTNNAMAARMQAGKNRP